MVTLTSTHTTLLHFNGRQGRPSAPNCFLSLGLFKIIGISTKWIWHEKHHQMWDCTLSSCRYWLLPTVSRMWRVIVCERKHKQFTFSFYIDISTAKLSFLMQFMFFHHEDHFAMKQTRGCHLKFSTFCSVTVNVRARLLFFTSFSSPRHKIIATSEIAFRFLEQFGR